MQLLESDLARVIGRVGGLKPGRPGRGADPGSVGIPVDVRGSYAISIPFMSAAVEKEAVNAAPEEMSVKTRACLAQGLTRPFP
ncbi:MAG: hypothetical protein A3G80_07450 [Betaproteobacteria bacterium RIFCSPLOWO2_12_FULL_62_13b]|nr:MAG: hypothetical protein A3G80_07450 [Betaproteobacteria bacterium RIFCSPLOWO2_12_FULL_62_13b]